MDRNGIGKDLMKEECGPREDSGNKFDVDTARALESKHVEERLIGDTSNKEEGEVESSMVSTSESTKECSNVDNYEETENRTSEVPIVLGFTCRMDAFQHSSDVEISNSSESFRTPPRPPRSLDHCITAPVGTPKNLFLENLEIAFSRSMTEKRVTPRRDLKLDRLSEREKEKLIVELVKIQKDGTVEVDLTKNSPAASELLDYHSVEGLPADIDFISTDSNKLIPRLKVAMLVVGTRGDVQPFLAVAKRLQEFGHHVRLATHANFRTFVESAGVEFFPLGGDPRVLAGYMARNKGLIPSAPGEISIQRKQLKAIIESLLPACTEPAIKSGEPFRAQAIIANPPAYGHAHVAEALGVPLHIFFTMPWTQANI